MSNLGGFGMWSSGGGSSGATVTVYGNPFFSTSNNTLLDPSIVYFGQVGQGTNNLASSSHVPQVAGKITGFALAGFNASTVGSNEDCTIILYYNNVVDSATITTTFKVSANRSNYQVVTGLDIDINDGNTAIGLQTFTLATNPTAFRIYAVPIFTRTL